MQTLHDNRLAPPLSSHSGVQHGSYVLHCYAKVVSTSCDEEEPPFVDEAMKLENYLATMQLCNQNMMLL